VRALFLPFAFFLQDQQTFLFFRNQFCFATDFAIPVNLETPNIESNVVA
jgi:hypothetical protein